MEALRRFVDGDINAFEAIFRENERDIYRLLLQMVATAFPFVMVLYYLLWKYGVRMLNEVLGVA
jgi:hypothetical protein